MTMLCFSVCILMFQIHIDDYSIEYISFRSCIIYQVLGIHISCADIAVSLSATYFVQLELSTLLVECTLLVLSFH